MTSCYKILCENGQDADFVTPVTDWRRRFFLETFGCLKQRPFNRNPGQTNFHTQDETVALQRQSSPGVN